MKRKNSHLNRMNKTLDENELNDLEGCPSHTDVPIEEGLKDLLQVDLDDCTSHSTRYISHVLQTFIFAKS